MAKNNDDGELSVELELDDGRVVVCDVITDLEVEGRKYAALLPRDQDEDSEESEVWFYELNGDLEDLSVEPELIYIEDDAIYDKVTAAFDEFLDSDEFAAMMEED